MSLRYTRLKKSPRVFSALHGVSVEQFDEIVKKLHPLWEETVTNQYKRPGRDYALPMEERVMVLLIYYRSYITQLFVGWLFGIDESNVCRIIKKLEPLLEQVVGLKKERKISKEEVENLIIDAFEQPIERPEKDQKPYYSGKKKCHTLKTEIRINVLGEIQQVSPSYPGATHDFNVFKMEGVPNGKACILADSGYQGIQHLSSNTLIPFKASKKNPLTKAQRGFNKCLSAIRVTVEHVIGDMKCFRILSNKYRNKRKRYDIKCNIVAGLVNIRSGFATG